VDNLGLLGSFGLDSDFFELRHIEPSLFIKRHLLGGQFEFFNQACFEGILDFATLLTLLLVASTEKPFVDIIKVLPT